VKFILILSILFTFGCTKKSNDPIIAQVGNSTFTYSQLKEKLLFKNKQFGQYKTLQKSQLALITKDIVDDFIYQTLVSNWANKNNIFIHPDELNNNINLIKKNYPNQKYFAEELNSQNLTETEWTQQLKFSLLEKKTTAKISEQLPEPSENLLLKFYKSNLKLFVEKEKIKIRQIVTNDEIKANKALDALRKKYSFMHAYEKYSDNYSKFKSPQINWIHKDSSKNYKALFSIKNGGHSPIFKSGLGFHIAQILDRKKRQQLSFEQAKKNITAIYLKQSQKNRLLDWLKSELENTKIYINQSFINNVRFEQKVIND